MLNPRATKHTKDTKGRIHYLIDFVIFVPFVVISFTLRFPRIFIKERL
jgi:hypothetical protein